VKKCLIVLSFALLSFNVLAAENTWYPKASDSCASFSVEFKAHTANAYNKWKQHPELLKLLWRDKAVAQLKSDLDAALDSLRAKNNEEKPHVSAVGDSLGTLIIFSTYCDSHGTTLLGAINASDIISSFKGSGNSPSNSTLLNSNRYQKQIESWLDPFKSSYTADSPWWGFYSYAIAEAKDVDSGKISEQEAAKMIDERRLKLNQEIASTSVPKLATLNCLLVSGNGEQNEIGLTIDYTNMQVNGYKAEFHENVIRWSIPATNGSTKFYESLNRLSGFYNSGSDQFPSLWTGHCAPATKQF